LLAVQIAIGYESTGKPVTPACATQPPAQETIILCPTVSKPPDETYTYAVPDPLEIVAVMPFVKAETVLPIRTLHGEVAVQLAPILITLPDADTARTFGAAIPPPASRLHTFELVHT